MSLYIINPDSRTFVPEDFSATLMPRVRRAFTHHLRSLYEKSLGNRFSLHFARIHQEISDLPK
jgi:hypothetical protein